jgi:hypothetical protein
VWEHLLQTSGPMARQGDHMDNKPPENDAVVKPVSEARIQANQRNAVTGSVALSEGSAPGE